MSSLLTLVVASFLVYGALPLSQRVVFPLTKTFTRKNVEKVESAFDKMVDSTEFIQREATSSGCTKYKIPLFGEDCVMTFQHAKFRSSSAIQTTTHDEEPSAFVLQVDGATKDDFGWICMKFYESRNSFEGIDMKNLEQRVLTHLNNLPLNPGIDAGSARLAGSDHVRNLFQSSSGSDVMKELKSEGFVVLDAGPKTTWNSNQQLSDFLFHETGQDTTIRSDKVAYMEREDAISCGLGHHYDLLMSIASYLNKNYDFEPSLHKPIFPATVENPLTNPSRIQVAEYGKGNFYVAHSDNAWADGKHLSVRRNFRCFTAILYCNSDWEVEDGGALRIYKDSMQLEQPQDAYKKCQHTDVIPQNGRLLIFDSRLVHSVEEVMTNKYRRALTIWIKRPSDESSLGKCILDKHELKEVGAIL